MSNVLKNIVYLLVPVVCFAGSIVTAEPLPPLQPLIDRTPEGQVVPLKPGRYAGPAVLDKRVILDGKGHVTIDGQGKGSVLKITADGVVVKDLVITNSGGSYDKLDAGIQVRSSHNKILDNTIHNTLFGIDLQQAHNNVIMGNDISSKDLPLGLRGDGVRIWASHRNVFRHNKIHDSRDMVIWYSNDNIIEDNEGWNDRYSLHFMYSGGNKVRRNRYRSNTVGIFVMYSRDVVLEQNEIQYCLGSTGVGIGLKESDNITILNNKIVYCTDGIYNDLSPYQPETYIFIMANIIAYNMVGIYLNSGLSRNVFKGNAFIDNLTTLRVGGNDDATRNVWEGNYYSDYEGFDRDKDGYGDSPFKDDIYLDTLWMNNDWMLLFRGSPVMSVLNLIARLIPITRPKHLMTDPKPVFSPSASVLFSKENLRFTPPKINVEKEQEGEAPPPWLASGGGSEQEAPHQEVKIKALEENPNFNRYFLRQ